MEHLDDEEINAVARLLSCERLGTFEALAGSTRAAIGLHQQLLRFAGTLMSVTAVVEIALRNAVCDRLAEYFQVEGWLRRPPPTFSWKDEERGKIEAATRSAQRAAYVKLNSSEKRALDAVAFRRGVPTGLRHEFRLDARQKSIAVSTGQVVTQLTLYFWKRLFSDDYEQTLWKSALKRIFPDKRINRSAVATQLERIYQTRNRIAHHEPIYGYRLRDTLAAIDFIASNLGVADNNGCTPLRKILRHDRDVLEHQASALQIRTDAVDTTSGASARFGYRSSHAAGQAMRARRHAAARTSHPVKPRSPDPPRW